MTNGADRLAVRLVQCKVAAPRSGLPGLDFAVNPYRGCGHACSYCYAQDVTRFELGKPWGECIEAKTNIAQTLNKELKRGPKGVYGVGTVTDPYQPVEERFELTRGCLSVLKGAGAEVSILTKSDLVLRDLDILRGWPNAEVGISVASLDEEVARLLERAAAPPLRRLDALQRLVDAGVRTYAMAAPIVRGVSDSEESLRSLVRKVSEAGTRTMMWDKYNPKPMATSRMRKRFAERGADAPRVHTPDEVKRLQVILKSECEVRKIELLNAF